VGRRRPQGGVADLAAALRAGGALIVNAAAFGGRKIARLVPNRTVMELDPGAGLRRRPGRRRERSSLASCTPAGSRGQLVTAVSLAIEVVEERLSVPVNSDFPLIRLALPRVEHGLISRRDCVETTVSITVSHFPSLPSPAIPTTEPSRCRDVDTPDVWRREGCSTFCLPCWERIWEQNAVQQMRTARPGETAWTAERG